MKKFLLFILFLEVAMHLKAGYESPSMERIKKQGKLIVALYAQDVAPFFVIEGKELKGFDVDLAKNIAMRLHVKPEFNRDAETYNEVIDLVFEKKADIGISLLSNTLERSKKVMFTSAYLNLHQTLVINRKIKAKARNSRNTLLWVNSEENTLGVLDGSSYIEFARDSFPDVSLILFPSSKSLFQSVLDGKIHAALTDNIEIKYWFDEKPEVGIDVQTMILNDKIDPIAIAVNWDDSHLLYWLNQYLNYIQTDGTLEQLKKKYQL